MKKIEIKVATKLVSVLAFIILFFVSVKFIYDEIDNVIQQDDVTEFADGVNNVINDFDKYITRDMNNINLQHIIDSSQNIIRDSIKQSQLNTTYWSSYDTGLPNGKVIRMISYEGTNFKLENKVSTEYDYGIITIEKDDGTLVKEKISYEWYLVINPNDKIK